MGVDLTWGQIYWRWHFQNEGRTVHSIQFLLFFYPFNHPQVYLLTFLEGNSKMLPPYQCMSFNSATMTMSHRSHFSRLSEKQKTFNAFHLLNKKCLFIAAHTSFSVSGMVNEGLLPLPPPCGWERFFFFLIFSSSSVKIISQYCNTAALRIGHHCNNRAHGFLCTFLRRCSSMFNGEETTLPV